MKGIKLFILKRSKNSGLVKMPKANMASSGANYT